MRKRNPSPISTPPSEQTTAEDSGGDSAAEEGLNNQEVSKDSVSAEKCDLSETEKDSEQIEEEQTTKLADGYYEIEAVRRKRVRKGQVQYLIKWRGWPETENTWEPYKNLLEVSDVIDTFEESLKAGKSKLRRKKKRQHSITHVLPKKKQRQQSPPPATYSVDPHVIQIADEGIPFPTLNDLVDRNEDSEVNANGVNIDELSEKTNENGVSIASPTIEELKELSDLDLKLCELKRERATSMESTHTVPVASGEGEVLTSTKELQAMYRADAAQPGRKTGAKKRKSGTVKRFKKDPASCSVEDAKILEVPSVRYPDLAVNSKNKHEDCYSSCAITQILRPISYSSSISNNVQDVLVAFEALRADGSKVTVDNKFLKANNPHVLIDYYERNLRYNPT